MRIAIACLLAAVLGVLSVADARERILERTARLSEPSCDTGGLPSGRRTPSCEPADLLAQARANVVASPLSASTLSDLGYMLLANGDGARGAAALELAGSLGWRDQPTQLYWLSAAQQAGDATITAQRLDALLRTDPSGKIAAALVPLEATSQGRAALAERIRYNPAWKNYALIDVASLPAAGLDNRLATIALARRLGATFDCGLVRDNIRRATEVRADTPAARLWDAACGTASAPSSGRLDFSAADARSPFGWRLASRGGLEVRIGDGPAPLTGEALEIRSDGPLQRPAAQRPLSLSPGAYRLSWRAVTIEGDLKPSLDLRCDGRPGTLVSAPSSSASVVTVEVPGSGCARQLMIVRGSDNGVGAAWIGQVDLRPVTN